MSYRGERKRRHSGDRGGGSGPPGQHEPSPEQWNVSSASASSHHRRPPSSGSPAPPPPSSSSRGRPRSSSYDPIKVGYHDDQESEHDRPHDRALVRAMNSELKQTKDHQSDPGKTLFVGRLNSSTTEDALRMHFERFGDIRSLFLIRDILTGESRRYAFIEFRRSKEADRAYSEGHNTMLDGRRILVDRELGRTMKNWKPRRLGGGYGGQKESGQIRFGGRGGNDHRGPPRDRDHHRDHHRPSDYDRRDHHRSSRSAPYPPPSRRSTNGFHHDFDDMGPPRSSRSLYSNGGSSSYRHSSFGGGGPIRSSRR